jgi:hypothetical protein
VGADTSGAVAYEAVEFEARQIHDIGWTSGCRLRSLVLTCRVFGEEPATTPAVDSAGADKLDGSPEPR